LSPERKQAPGAGINRKVKSGSIAQAAVAASRCPTQAVIRAAGMQPRATKLTPARCAGVAWAAPKALGDCQTALREPMRRWRRCGTHVASSPPNEEITSHDDPVSWLEQQYASPSPLVAGARGVLRVAGGRDELPGAPRTGACELARAHRSRPNDQRLVRQRLRLAIERRGVEKIVATIFSQQLETGADEELGAADLLVETAGEVLSSTTSTAVRSFV